MTTNSGIPTNATLAQWPTLHAFRVLVTPEMATEWLASTNVDNRHVRSIVVKRYAALMKEGEWKPTHQGVAFSRRRLIDGQHRLSAIVAAGKPQWMVVFVEQDDDVFGVLDRGTARTLRDEVRLDKTITDAVAWLSKLGGENGITSALSMPLARRALDAFLPHLSDMLASVNAKAKYRTVAAIRGAVALRLASSSGQNRRYILDMWRAWAILDVDAMSVSLKSALKRLDNSGGMDSGTSLSNERACIAWIAFDPEARNLNRITIKSAQAEMAEMRSAFLAALGVE